MKNVLEPADAVAFISSDEAGRADGQCARTSLSFEKGLLGDGAPSADFRWISFPPGDKTLGDANNIKLRLTLSYIKWG